MPTSNGYTQSQTGALQSSFSDLEDLTGFIIKKSQYSASSGGYADIWVADSTRAKLAVKVIRSFTDNQCDYMKKLDKVIPSSFRKGHRLTLKQRLRREVVIWKELEHKNILPLLGIVRGFGPYVSMVCPWMAKGSLTQYLGRRGSGLCHQRRLQIIREVASGLAYLHSKDVIHGDLSGSNILLDDAERVCISDFGLATIVAQFRGTSLDSSTVSGAIRWMAPDIMYQVMISRAASVIDAEGAYFQILDGHSNVILPFPGGAFTAFQLSAPVVVPDVLACIRKIPPVGRAREHVPFFSYGSSRCVFDPAPLPQARNPVILSAIPPPGLRWSTQNRFQSPSHPSLVPSARCLLSPHANPPSTMPHASDVGIPSSVHVLITRARWITLLPLGAAALEVLVRLVAAPRHSTTLTIDTDIQFDLLTRINEHGNGGPIARRRRRQDPSKTFVNKLTCNGCGTEIPVYASRTTMCDSCWAGSRDKRKANGRPSNTSQGSRAGRSSVTANAYGHGVPNISIPTTPLRDSDSSSLSSLESSLGFEQPPFRDQSPATPYSPAHAANLYNAEEFSGHSHLPPPSTHLRPSDQGASPSYFVYNHSGVSNANVNGMPMMQLDQISPYIPVQPIPAAPSHVLCQDATYSPAGPEFMSPLPSPALSQFNLPPDDRGYYQDPSSAAGYSYPDHYLSSSTVYQGGYPQTPALAISAGFSELSNAVDPAQGRHSGHYAPTTQYAQSQDILPESSSLSSLDSSDWPFHPAPARQGSGDTVKMDVDQDEGSGSSQDTVDGGFSGYLNSTKKLSPPTSLR
ncbi:hypothetical protein CCMSSC00406_0006036 [Pleurotus cornucopiae]|uniref:Uncharacterized protein n=1 Tax=Pleurotus cornucopiae TaxID=5321 RepID=A0ACB7IN39_PLECO|nr:hypothetical protein CCMSSC00406_0006036 [Pleurotus cornucopiae]